MSDTSYVQLAYASTATFGDGRLEDPETQRNVMQIVRRGRQKNPEWGIGGVFHFSDGYFFQALEGPAEAVDTLFEAIQHDQRHKHIRVLRYADIDAPSFASWSMKVFTLNREIAQLVTGALHKRFNPYRMTPATLDALLAKLTGPRTATAHIA